MVTSGLNTGRSKIGVINMSSPPKIRFVIRNNKDQQKTTEYDNNVHLEGVDSCGARTVSLLLPSLTFVGLLQHNVMHCN